MSQAPEHEGLGQIPQSIVGLPDGRQIEINLPEALRPLAEITGKEEIILAWYQQLVVSEITRREISLGHKIKSVPQEAKNMWMQGQIELLERKIQAEPTKTEKKLAKVQQDTEKKLAEIALRKENTENRLREEGRVARIMVKVHEREVARIEAETKKAEESNIKIGINVARSMQLAAYAVFSGAALMISEAEAITKWVMLASAATSWFAVKEIFYRLCEVVLVIASRLSRDTGDNAFDESMKEVHLLEKSNFDGYQKRMAKISEEFLVDLTENASKFVTKVSQYSKKYPFEF